MDPAAAQRAKLELSSSPRNHAIREAVPSPQRFGQSAGLQTRLQVARSWIERSFRGIPLRTAILALFAIAMGHLEAVVVVYIRYALGDLQGTGNVPQQTLLAFPWQIEQTREAATLIMLATLAALVGRDWLERVAALLWAFAIWDATYYASLRVMLGWPASLFTPDIYFLLPVPWGGPVWVPLLADVLMACAAAAALVYGGRRARRVSRAGLR